MLEIVSCGIICLLVSSCFSVHVTLGYNFTILVHSHKVEIKLSVHIESFLRDDLSKRYVN